ncbi:acetolactate synthase large subunit [Patulibacter sp.]|uniref:acetolactate synthase large subunit n=1 Tax=Patulibacter sp. TaxID=1912859 RepID=UPI00271F2AD6|nr:acetolactate synthase large subunit [Patulibacter sp.]MDO9409227.1 acetolactate synthase large subunit [Patulibacter sp.]
MSVTAAQLLVRCLEAEGVQYVFGIPGEENIHFVQALDDSEIRYVLVRHEQAASFMAEMYGRLTQRAAVCSATLGPGAINLQLGVADAQTNSTPLIALTAQVGRDRSYKESHQGIDLVPMFAPITKWSALIPTPESIPEILRKAFKTAQTERPGAVYLAVPEDIESAEVPDDLVPLRIDRVRPNEPTDAQVDRAVELLLAAERPIVLAGHGAAREDGAAAQLVRFAEATGIPVAATFHAKGVFPDDHPLGLGAVGFMRHDYVNFGFDAADTIVAVGYELQEFDPKKVNPEGDATIIHVHRFPAEVDRHYPVDVGLHGSIGRSLELFTEAFERADAAADSPAPWRARKTPGVAALLRDELDAHADDEQVPLSPQRIVADTRAALGREDIVLADTGAVKMWMARLYPTYAPNTCLLSNGLSTMGFSLPGALGAKLARPDAKILAATGDGAFLMHAQELETAVREGIPLCVLVWEDDGYGLIEWKMEMELGTSSSVKFGNPDVVAFTESFGGTGVRITEASQLLPALRAGLESDGVTVIAVPVDYRENLKLTERLGELEAPL